MRAYRLTGGRVLLRGEFAPHGTVIRLSDEEAKRYRLGGCTLEPCDGGDQAPAPKPESSADQSGPEPQSKPKAKAKRRSRRRGG